MGITIAYGSHPLQTIHVNQVNEDSHFVVFIHGGAWVDPKQTYHDGDVLLNSLYDGGQSKRYNTAAMNYRLSPEVKHPEHLKDVRKSLDVLVEKFGVKRITLVGHSAGAFLACQAVLSEIDPESYVDYSVTAIIGIEGIYDLPKLLEEHSDYSSFVNKAFEPADLVDASPATYNLRKRLFILHSKSDELLGFEWQPQIAYKRFASTELVEVPGTHDGALREVSTLESVHKIIASYT